MEARKEEKLWQKYYIPERQESVSYDADMLEISSETLYCALQYFVALMSFDA